MQLLLAGVWALQEAPLCWGPCSSHSRGLGSQPLGPKWPRVTEALLNVCLTDQCGL